MRWPWSSSGSSSRLCVRCHSRSDGGCDIAYVLSDPSDGREGPQPVLQWGAQSLTAEQSANGGLAQALSALALKPGEVIALLEPDEYQILKVDTPNVPNEELKAAARWQIKDMVDVRLEDLILDVMHVGGDAPRAQRQLFVIAARNSSLTGLTGRLESGAMMPRVVDTWETALRNLQTLQAESEGLRERACAALQIMGDSCLLTVSANGELYYTRRLDVDANLVARASGSGVSRVESLAPLGMEYQPGGELNGDDEDEEESVLIIELQRTIDLWERSWPELPLARLYVAAARHGEALASLIQRELGLRTVALSLPGLFSGLDQAAERADDLAACLPLLGASLRSEQRVL